MVKRIIIAVLGLLLVIGLLGGIKSLQIRKMIAQGAQFVPPPEISIELPAEALRDRLEIAVV